MTERKLVRDRIEQLHYHLNGMTVETACAYLVERAGRVDKNKYKSVEIAEIEDSDPWNPHSVETLTLYMVGVREETDIEYNNRVKEDAIEAERRKKWELKQLEELKKKYG